MRDGGLYTPSWSRWKDAHWMRRVKRFCNRRIYSWPRKTSQTRAWHKFYSQKASKCHYTQRNNPNQPSHSHAAQEYRPTWQQILNLMMTKSIISDGSDSQKKIKKLFRISNFLVFEQFPAYFTFKLGRDTHRNSFHRNYFVQKELGGNCWEIIPILPNGPELHPIRIFLG